PWLRQPQGGPEITPDQADDAEPFPFKDVNSSRNPLLCSHALDLEFRGPVKTAAPGNVEHELSQRLFEPQKCHQLVPADCGQTLPAHLTPNEPKLRDHIHKAFRRETHHQAVPALYRRGARMEDHDQKLIWMNHADGRLRLLRQTLHRSQEKPVWWWERG